MAIVLSQKFLDELKRCENTPNVVVEFELDGGTVRFGYHGRNVLPLAVFRADGAHLAAGQVSAIGSDELPFVVPALKSVSSLQNKIDSRAGYSTRGQLAVVISGVDNFAPIVRDEHLKNRRVTRKDGFVASGVTWLDYAATFTGRVLDWSRKGPDLTVIVADDLKDASTSIPVASETGVTAIDYRAMNPADIMADILTSELGIQASSVDLESFTTERDAWLQGWVFDRVLTEPREANQYLNELQAESNSFLIHDGEKVAFKVFAPPVPGAGVEEWSDRDLLDGSFSMKSGYRDGFCNRVVVYYDYDESGGEGASAFEAAVIASDAASQGPSQWNETGTRTIMSRWIRTYTFTEEPGLPGVKVYHASRTNGEGTGVLTFNRAASTLVYAAPNGAAGPAQNLSRDGRYQMFDADGLRYVRVMVETASLPQADGSTGVVLAPIGGQKNATALAHKVLHRYKDPVATVAFDVDINCMSTGSRFMRPTDMKDLTTVEACSNGHGYWSKNRVMLTSVRPDFASGKVSVEAVETKMSRRYAFIAPPGRPDYDGASGAERAYGYVGGASNLTGGLEGYYIW